ncbi:unannotated protein [freshwater metagenome]|uniref:Unannotated protein n=1 Tax=freshwater metagenome TaxID=449393 RepID=A0A6J6L6X9_9ZZZZ|nr:hypothetical protein [Actinomycetota bacterium]
MRKRIDPGHDEDATLLAGWMYADLLLGLMVIFLATISFVPIDNFISKSLVKANYKQVDKAFNFNRGLSLVYDKFDAAGLEKDIEAFKKREGLDNDSEIIFAQILGGYDPKTEDVENGRNRALQYSFSLTEDKNGLFRNASVTAGGESGLKKDQIALRLTFVSKLK